MNKKLLHTINRSLESTKTTHYAPVTIDALQARLTEELDWLDADPGRECLILLLQELAAKMRSARIVVSPGYSYLPDSYLLFLTASPRSIRWNGTCLSAASPSPSTTVPRFPSRPAPAALK